MIFSFILPLKFMQLPVLEDSLGGIEFLQALNGINGLSSQPEAFFIEVLNSGEGTFQDRKYFVLSNLLFMCSFPSIQVSSGDSFGRHDLMNLTFHIVLRYGSHLSVLV